MTKFLLSMLFLMGSAQALELRFLKGTPDGYDNFKIFGKVKLNMQYTPDIYMHGPTRIFFSSSGGVTAGSQNFLKWFHNQITWYRVKPTVVLNAGCDSACITILAGLNQMAGKGEIKLVLDESLSLGFHGCYNMRYKAFNQPCTDAIKKEQISYGMNPAWIRNHEEFYIRPQPKYMKHVKVTDPTLNDSGLIDHAIIKRDTANWLK